MDFSYETKKQKTILLKEAKNKVNFHISDDDYYSGYENNDNTMSKNEYNNSEEDDINSYISSIKIKK